MSASSNETETNSHVVVSLDLTTPTNIALLKQLTETLSVVNETALKNAGRFIGPDPFAVTECAIMKAIQIIASFPQHVESEAREDQSGY